MFERKRIDFTNIANKVNNEVYYAIASFTIIILIILTIVFFVIRNNSNKNSNNNVSPQTPIEKVDNKEKEENKTPEENKNSSVYDTLSQIDRAKAGTFIANVKVLYQNSIIMHFSQTENGIKVTEISPRRNSIETTLDYCVKLNDNGNITKIQAADSIFYIEIENVNSMNDIDVKNVKKGKIPFNECK